MYKSLSKKQTVYFFILSILIVVATILPFQYLPDNSLSLFSAIFGTQTLQPLTFINTISLHISRGGFGFVIAQILCWSIVSFIISSVLFGILNLVVLINPHNIILLAFRNYCTYMYLSISILACSTISVWAITSMFLYGVGIVLMFGVALLFISTLAFTQTIVCFSCLKNSSIKLELTAYEKVQTAKL